MMLSSGLTYHHVRSLPAGAMLSRLLPVTCLQGQTSRGITWSQMPPQVSIACVRTY